MTTLGNVSLLEQALHGFVCSRTTKSSVILPCLDWASRMSGGKEVVMSTFHSPIEKSVLEILLRGNCPIAIVLGRKLYKEVPSLWKKSIEEGRMLIVSLTEQSRISQQSALESNKFILEKSEDVFVGFASPNGNLDKLLKNENIRYKLIWQH